MCDEPMRDQTSRHDATTFSESGSWFNERLAELGVHISSSFSFNLHGFATGSKCVKMWMLHVNVSV